MRSNCSHFFLVNTSKCRPPRDTGILAMFGFITLVNAQPSQEFDDLPPIGYDQLRGGAVW